MLAYLMLFAFVLLLPAFSAHAQQSESDSVEKQPKKFKITMVLWRGATDVERGFERYFQERGIPYQLTVRNLDRDRGRIPAIIEEIRRDKPDLVYTWGTGTTLGVAGALGKRDRAKHIHEIPVVFTLVAYPKLVGLIKDDENPGENVTGVRFLADIDVQLNSIRGYLDFDKLAVIYNPKAANSIRNVEQLREESAKSAFKLIELPAPIGENGRPIDSAVGNLVAQAVKQKADIIYMGPDSYTFVNREALTNEATKAGIPTFAATEAPLNDSKVTFGLVSRYFSLGKLTGSQAEKILVGKKKAGKVPVAQLSRFSFVINMPVIRELGIYPPMSVLRIADIIK